MGRFENMSATLDLLSEKYGGAEGYVKTYCGLSEEEIAIIRMNLITEDA